ncbi:MAG: hypothetical protein Kow00100_06650 [Geothermobacteraceae bacterium]
MKRMIQILLMTLVFATLGLAPAFAAKLSFPAGSLIVPMDPCWQPNNDTNLNSVFRPTGCEATKSDKGLFQAYGMVYEILRSGAKVGWVVRSDKTDPNQVDFTIAGIPDPANPGTINPPVRKFDRTKADPLAGANIDPAARSMSWSDNAGNSYSESFDAHVIDYRGGPFVIHKKFLTDEVMKIVKAFADVQVHVANGSFTAPIDKVLDKVPPKLAILGSGKVDILRTYLQAAGLLGLETLVFNEVTVEEIIEDVLTTPDADGNKYSLFWAPHWVLDEEISGPVTLSDGTVLTADQAKAAVLQKLRAFMEAGNSAFLECASIESIEGSEDMEKSGGGVDDPAIDAHGGWTTDGTVPGPRFYTDGGTMDPDKIIYDKPAGFLTQCAGWIYTPQGGHVHNFKPHVNVSSLYNNTVERYAHDPDGATQGYDYFIGGRINGSPTQGYVSYLGGHRYLECDNTWTPPGGSIVPVGPAPSKRTFDLTVNDSLNPTDPVILSFYYAGSSTAVDVTLSPDGSLNFPDEDGVLLSTLDDLTVNSGAGSTTFSGISLANLSPSEQTIDKVVVTWPAGAVAPPACVKGGDYSALLKSQSDVSDKTFCTGAAPGTDCNPPGGAVPLKDYHKQKKWDETPPEMQVTVTENTGVFQFYFYVHGITTPFSFELDLAGDFKPGASGDYDIRRPDTVVMKDAGGKDVLYVKLDKIQYNFSGGSFDNVVIKFKEISRANSYNSDISLDKIKVDWGCTTSGPAPPTYVLSENGATVATGENGVADTAISLPLGVISTGSGSEEPATSPTIDPANISYCDIKKNNTCGTRFVLNTVLGLQFTVITSRYVQASPIIDDNLVFQGSYEFPTYRGHFQAFDYTTNWAKADALVWDAADVMPPAGTGNPASITKTPASRYIFTNNGITKVAFDLTSVPDTNAYLYTQMGLSTLDEAKAWINTVRGRDKATPLLVAGEGEQSNRLWAIRTSTPAIVGGSSLVQNEHRDRIAYVGGDDGMLHAFYAGSYDSNTGKYTTGTGKEIWAYIPSTLLPYLKDQDYVDPNKEPVVSVSGSPAVRDVLMPKIVNGKVVGAEYRTILLATATVAQQNRGMIFALDVTDPYAPKILWETDLSSYNVGDAKGVALGKVRLGDSIGNWAFITANYHEPLDANGNVDVNNGFYGINALALDVFTGQVKWSWNENYAINNVSEPPAAPSLLDYDDNGVVDYVVFGDMDGRLWQLPAKGPETYQEYDPDTQQMVTKSKSIDPAYVPVDSNGDPLGHPIGAPVALYGKTAIFGTGGTDFAPDNVQYALYAVKLHDPPGGSLVWVAGATDAVGTGAFLALGEKIWGAPTIDGAGRIYIATGKGYMEQAAVDQNTSSTGRVMVLSAQGELLGAVATGNAAVGSVEIVDGGAIATDFSGNMMRLGNPTPVGDFKGIKVKIFSWRLR